MDGTMGLGPPSIGRFHAICQEDLETSSSEDCELRVPPSGCRVTLGILRRNWEEAPGGSQVGGSPIQVPFFFAFLVCSWSICKLWWISLTLRTCLIYFALTVVPCVSLGVN